MRLERQLSSPAALSKLHIKITLLAALACPAFAIAQSSDPADRLMQAEVAYEKMQPSGMAIEAKEVSRSGESGKDLAVQYRLFIHGAKPGALFQQIDWRITADQPTKSLAGISVAADGSLLCPANASDQCGEGSKSGDLIKLTTHTKPGEPLRLAFESDGTKVGLVLVPDPIQSRDKLCTLEAIRLTPKFEVAYITGSGYPANSEVHYKVLPLSDQDFTVKADASGTIRTTVVPHASGNATLPIKVKIDETACSPEVAYGFGS